MYLWLILLVAMIALMFFMTRKQRQEQSRQAAMQQSLKVGDRVITVSGLYGTVVEVDDASVDLEIAEDVVTTWLRAAIREVRSEDTTEVEATPTEEATVDAPTADVAEPDKN